MTFAPLAPAPAHVDVVADYRAAMQATGRKAGRSTMQAARTFCAKVERAGGWEQMSRARQLDAIKKARSFAPWLMVTGRLVVDADVFGRVNLWLGVAARSYCPEAYAWFSGARAALGTRQGDVTLQRNALAKVTAISGAAPDGRGARRRVHRRLACPRRRLHLAGKARVRPEPGIDPPSAAAHVVSRRTPGGSPAHSPTPASVGHRLGGSRPRLRSAFTRPHVGAL